MKKFLCTTAILLALGGCGQIIDTGNRGVETRFGEVVGSPLPEGFHWYNPITSEIHEISVKTRVWTQEGAAYTKDVQVADITFSINYNLDPDKVLDVYKTVGEKWEERLVAQAVPAIMKNVIGKWDAVELIANRSKATTEIEKDLMESLGKQGVIVTRFELTGIGYKKPFEDAVEAKVIAIQQASQAENTTKKIAEEAKQTVISAKADAEAMKIKSDALAQNKSLVEYEAVKKWDGVLPTTMLGNTTPFINLKSGATQ